MRILIFAGAPLLLAGLAAFACSGVGAVDDEFDFAELDASLLPVGSPVPDVTVTDMDDQPVALSSLRGKTLLVNFWFYG